MKKFLGILLSLMMIVGATAAMAEFDYTQDITVVSREDGSGTRGAFIELLGVEKEDENGEKVDYTTEEAVITNSTNVMMTTVAGNEAAIGYSSMGSLNESVKALQVNGVAATVENIKAGTYEVARPFNIATKEGLSETAQDFVNFIMSEQGQAIVAEEGYISVENSGSYTPSGKTGTVTVSGSSSVTPVMQVLKEEYEALNPDVTIELQQSDSTTGVNDAIAGTSDIGMASRALKDSELEQGVVGTVIANDGIAVIVNNESTVTGLTSEQVKGIYMGELTNWSEVA